MSFLDSAATLDPAQTPWAPKVPLAAAPSTPAAPAQKPVVAAVQSQAPEAKAARITPETHPHFFEAEKPAAPAAGGDDIGSYMASVRKRESGGNDLAGNGTAFGRYQFTPQTWLGVAARHPELGLRPEDIWSGEKQDQAMRAFTADNAKVLQEQGLPADPANLNMLHFLGTGNGPKFLKLMGQNPQADAAQLFPLEAKYNPTIFFEKSGAPRTLMQIYDHMSSTIGAGGAGHAAPGVAQGVQSATLTSSAAPLVEGRAADGKPEEDIPDAARVALGLAVKPVKAPETAKPQQEEVPPAARAALGLPTQQEEYDKFLGAKPDTDAPPQGLIEQFGEKQARELWKDPNIRNSVAVSNATEGALPGGGVGSEVGNVSGAAQAITGLGELLPNWLGGGYAAEATQGLQKIGDPAAQKQGLAAATMLPLGAGVTGAKAALEGAEGASLLARGAGAAREGALGGGRATAIQPTGQVDSTERAKAKVEEIGLGAAGGAAGAAIVPAAAAALREVAAIPRFLQNAWGGAAKKAAEELRTGVSAETGRVLTEAEQKIRTAEVTEGLQKLKASMEDTAATNQERKAVESETARQAIIEKHAAGPTKPPEQVGDEFHKTATEDMEALKKERAEKSGFDKAVASDGGKPSVPTDKFIAQSDKILATSKSEPLRAAVQSFKKELTNAPSVKGQKAIQAVSIKQAREILETVNGKIEELPPGPAHELMKLRDSFVSHLEETHPQLKAAKQKYAELSRPLDVYERTGALKKSVMEDPYSGKATLDATKIKSAVLGKTKEGSEALGRLIEKNPALRDSVRETYRHELFGSGAAGKTPTTAQLRTFLQNNRLGLEKSNLYDEFAAMKTEREVAEKSVETETAKAKEMRGTGKSETQKSVESLAKQAADAKATKADFATLDTELSKARKSSDVTSAAERTAKAMVRNGSIDQEKYGKLLDQIHDVEEKNADHVKAATLVKQIIRAAVVAGTAGVGGYEIGHYVSHRVNP